MKVQFILELITAVVMFTLYGKHFTTNSGVPSAAGPDGLRVRGDEKAQTAQTLIRAPFGQP